MNSIVVVRLQRKACWEIKAQVKKQFRKLHPFPRPCCRLTSQCRSGEGNGKKHLGNHGWASHRKMVEGSPFHNEPGPGECKTRRTVQAWTGDGQHGFGKATANACTQQPGGRWGGRAVLHGGKVDAVLCTGWGRGVVSCWAHAYLGTETRCTGLNGCLGKAETLYKPQTPGPKLNHNPKLIGPSHSTPSLLKIDRDKLLHLVAVAYQGPAKHNTPGTVAPRGRERQNDWQNDRMQSLLGPWVGVAPA